MSRFLKGHFVLPICIFFTTALSAQPIVNTFSPASGPAGTTVTISGANFNTSPDSNVVFFGAVKAVVTAATASTLTVTAPVSATYDPISVLNSGTRLIGYSYKTFLETFNGGATAQTVINATRLPAVNFGIGDEPEAPITTDVDGDGRPDIVINNGAVAIIFRNTSSPGTINYSSLAAYVTFYAGEGAANLVMRDLNGDGKPDLICAANGNNFHAYISLNTSTPGHISFGAAQAFAFSGGLIDAADMDGDGRLDLVMAANGGVAIWLNTTPAGGGLSFADPVTYGISGNTFDMTVTDIDGDRKPDVVCSNNGDKTISILRNTFRAGVANDSSFAPYVVIPTNRQAGQLTVRDIDADGKPDIVVSTDSGVAILKNIATSGSITTASFAAEVDIPTGTSITGVAVGDIDGDGKPDIATSNFVGYGKGFVSILKNITPPGSITTASFAVRTDVHDDGYAYGVFINDIDGDGRPELLATNLNDPGELSIIRTVINTQAPVIAASTPDSASFGSVVTLSGHNFSGASAVSFGGVAAASFTVLSDTVITATPGNGASGSINVTTSLGTGTLPGFQFVLAPSITTFTPTTAGRGDTVVITGSRLSQADTITFGGTPTLFTVINDNTIKALVGNNGSTGNIVVKTPFGVDSVTGFTYINYPLISSFTPTYGKTGDAISIHGKYLTTASAVSFGGFPATSFTVVSDTVVTAVVGSGGIGPVSITTSIGSYSLEEFTYLYPAPVITGFSPGSGAAGSTVTITGSGFDPVATNNVVYFGGVKAYVSQGSATSLTVTVPAGATFGRMTVTSHMKTAYGKSFILTFGGSGTITTSSFGSPTSVGAGIALNLLDVDGDGKLDILSNISSTLAVLPNTGANGQLAFGAAVNLVSPGTVLAVPIAFADIDGDGKPDLLTSCGSGGYSAVVYRNLSVKGSFSLKPGLAFASAGVGTQYVAAGDFNGDGRPDIASTAGYNGYLDIFGNTTVNSAISFSNPLTETLGTNPAQTFVDDYDGDGKSDIIVDDGFNTAIFPFLSNAAINGNLSFLGLSTTYVHAMLDMASGDIDGDGKPDLVVGTSTNQIQIYLNTSTTGHITFAAPVILNLASTPNYIALGDLDGDGKIDIVTSEPGVDSIVIFHNTGTMGAPTFGPIVEFATAASPGMIAIGDVNGDGKPDIVLNANGQQYVYPNQVTAPSAPTLTSFTPTTAGPGVTVTLNGTNLTGTTSVTFGGAPAASFTVVSDNQVTAVVGQGASGSVLVTTPNGSASTDVFTYSSPVAQITGFTPVHAAAGEMVTITGSDFGGVTSVTFGGVPATSFNVINPGTITAIVGAANSGSIALFSAAGADSLGGFAFIPPPPVITSFTPTTVSAGNTVTITGTGFSGATAVSFGGSPASSFSVVSPTTINALVYGGASGNITVTTPMGTASSGGLTYIGTMSRIISFTPASGPPNTLITIVGTGFTGVTAVSFNGGLAPTFTVVSDDTIQAVIGSGASGEISITDQWGTPTSSTNFTLTNPVTTLTSFSPTAATTGNTVTISGTHLTDATGVSFGGTAASSFSVASDNTLIAIVGSGSTGNIVVNTPSGSDTLTGFTFTPYITVPSITAVYPWTGQPGDTVQIYGSGFTGTTSVTFGGVSTPFVIRNDGLLVATIGSGASGNIVVTNSAGTTQVGPWRFNPATPIITSFSPQSGPAGTLITIKGANLLTTWDALVGQSIGEYGLLNLTVVSDSVVTGNLNSLSTSGPVTVWAGGGDVSFGEFTVLPAGTPQISGISPVSGGQGTVDTITGLNFTGITAVTFGGVAANSFTIVSSTMITAVVGQGATGSIEVSGTGGSNSFAGFTYTGAPPDSTTTPPPAPHAPVLYSFSPTTAAHNDTVTINGIDLDSVVAISFGGTPAQSFNILNDSSIIAIVGTGATGKLIVNSPQGADTLNGFTFDTTATTPPPDSTTTPPPVQHILSLSSFTPTHAGQGDTVTIRGAYLDSTSFVSFGGTPAQSFHILNDSAIIAIVGTGTSGQVLVNSSQGIDSLNGFIFDTTGTTIPPDSTTTPPPASSSFQLTQFTGVASGNQALLQWSTLHEQHIATYIIEQGTDTIHFSPIGAIAAKEMDSASYSFTDTAQRTGVNFYRLSILDVAFDSVFSRTIAVQLAGIPWALTVYPNPVTSGYFTVTVPSILTPSNFQLADMSGNVVQRIQVSAGTLQQKIMTTGLQNGVYKIVWSDGTNSSFQTVLILK
jgi:FG-GAP-like repeat/IPT/TIG domain/Secretion system C-terminal sorting domain/FG-GAP repeat